MTAIDTTPITPVGSPVPPRRVSAWLVVGAVVGALLVVMSAASFAAMVARHTDTVTVTSQAAPRLVVHSSSGDVTVTGTDRDDFSGTARRTWSFVEPKIVTERVGDAIEMRVDCGWSFTGYCDATFDLEVPTGTAVDVHTSSGDVTASGLTAHATLTADSGRVHASGVAGGVTAGTSSGDVVLDGVSGDLDLRVTSGHIDVTDSDAARVTARASSGEIRLDLRSDVDVIDAHASSGSVAIWLPDTRGVAYALDLRTSSGNTSGQVRTDPASPRTITAATSSGDVSVAYR